MLSASYRIRIKLLVESLDESADLESEEVDGEGAGVDDDPRAPKPLLAVEVLVALCECPAGVRGGCHHAAMVLHLCRLLHMTEDQLVTFNPETVTGRACQWIVHNCKGGRSVSQCPWYGMPISQVTQAVRSMRDPKGMSRFADDAPVAVRGVTPIDRQNGFNPHPTGGKWDELKSHFDKGVTVSKAKREKLEAFVDGERSTARQQVALDFLPPRVREEDSP